MNIGIDELVKEIISICLEENGIPPEVVEKVLDDIKYNCKETNFIHNSVADNNWYAAEERKENEKVIAAKRELEELEKRKQKEIEDYQYELRRVRNVASDYYEKYGPLNNQ